MDANEYDRLKSAARAQVCKHPTDEGCICIERTSYNEETGDPVTTMIELDVEALRAQRDATQRDLDNLDKLLTEIAAVK